MIGGDVSLRRSGSESDIAGGKVGGSKAGQLRRSGSEANLLSRNLICTDVHLDRLPSNSPYVGTFHRGYKASKGGLVQSFDVHPDRLNRSCPYVGSFHRGWSVENALKAKESTLLEKFGKGNNKEDAAQSPKRPPIQVIMDGIDSSHLPKSPELCGLQAILPRSCGVRILDKIGEGSFGKVVLAVNKRNRACWTDTSFYRKLTAMPVEGGSVVLKCVKKEGCYGARGLDCVAREVAIHSKCCHPNISRMYGYYESGQYVTMILEFIDGKELFEILRNRRQLPEEEARTLVLQVLRGVSYLHDHNIVHRDLTPRNILVKESGHAFVIDLGLAMDLSTQSEGCDSQETHMGSPTGAMGTLGYIPPETMRQEKVSVGVDMWAVGTVLYESVFGFAPFAPHEVLSDAAVEFPDPMWGPSSDEMRDITAQMLDKQASKRISAAAALRHSWFTPAAMAAADRLAALVDESRAAPGPDGPDSGGPGAATGDEEEPPPMWLGGLGSRSGSTESESDLLSPLPALDGGRAPLEASGPEATAEVAPGSDSDYAAWPKEVEAPPRPVTKPPRRECVLQLKGERRGDASSEASDGGNVVYFARILPPTLTS